MNKFYFFTLTYYYISYIEKKKGFELFPGTVIISVYLFIGDKILYFIREYPDENNIFILYIIQMIFSGIGFLILLLSIIGTICCILCIPSALIELLFCCFSFLFCFGGIWFKFSDKENNDKMCCDCSEVNLDCYCCSISEARCYYDCCCCDYDSCFYSDCCDDNCSECCCDICCACCLI